MACTQVVPVPIDDLLSKEYAKKRRAQHFKPDKVTFKRTACIYA